MPYTIHRSKERGVAELGWLHSRFSFSFADYYNPHRMGFGALRVINDDVIEPGQGFGMHPHRDMEIITIVTEGVLEHEDSEGNHGIIKAGEVQYMSAASGIYHAEKNPSIHEKTALFQIWIYPNQKGGKPLYDKRDFGSIDQSNRWVTLVSGDGRENSIKIKQDASILSTELEEGKTLDIPPVKQEEGYLLFVVDGTIQIAGNRLDQRDEIQIIGEDIYTIEAQKKSKLLLFQVPIKSK